MSDPLAASQRAPLDQETMEALVALNERRGGTLLPAMIAAFVEQECPEALADIERARSTANAEALARAAHKIKGSSAALGALSLAELCAEIEQRGRAGDLPGAVDLLDLLPPRIQAAAEALSVYR